jgi:hypothetical protein
MARCFPSAAVSDCKGAHAQSIDEGRRMRGAAAILTAAWLLPTAAFAQDWQAYRYPDAGFAIQLPVPPMVEKGTFTTPAGVSLPMTSYVARQDGIIYTLKVVDFSSVNPDGTKTIADTEKSFGTSGKVTVAIDARVNREFGRELSVTGADGSRSAVAIFFANRRLYILDGQSLPPNAIARSGNAIRFQESLQFIGDNGGFGGFGGFGAFGRPGDRGRFGGGFRGGFNPQALDACRNRSVGDIVQIDTPRGVVTATCTLIARPNVPLNPPGPPN